MSPTARTRFTLGALLVVLAPRPAWAHPGLASAPHDVWTHWGAEPIELLLIAVPALWYAIGVRALWRAAGPGHGVSRGRASAFGLGMLTLLVALATPLDAMAEALFSAHMVQHLLLILVAAPLCVVGAPVVPMLHALSHGRRRRVGKWWGTHATARATIRLLTTPGLVLVVHTVALWFWHFPGPYQAALASRPVHALEHASFFGTAALFWWVVLQPAGRRRLGYGATLLLIGATLLQSGALGAVLLYARAPWYPAHGAGARAWGVTLLGDQRLAGVIMWVPAGFVYVGAAAWLFLRWLREDERRSAVGDARIVNAELRAVGRVMAIALLASVTAFANACSTASGHTADRRIERGDADRGKTAIRAYGCGSCHQIPGVQGARGLVGPPLDHWAERRIIAGEVPNDPEHLITWLTVPQAIEPGTAMPNMGVSDGEARDIAAYLYTLH